MNNISENSVSTFGWDTAYLASFPIVNKAIMAQKSFPSAFNYKDATDITISGHWESWQLIPGGAGGDVQLICKATSGSASGLGLTGDLSDSEIIIQVNLKQVASSDPVNDPTATNQGTTQQLVVNTQGVGVDPAVSVISTHYPKVNNLLLQDVLNSVFKDYFNVHINEFNHVFAVMNINEVADKEGFQWVKPTNFQYAVASPENGDINHSVFGLIAMVENHPINPYMQQAVDVRALINLPQGANAAFVISESLVAQKMLLRGAVATIQGSKVSDFGFSKDGLSVTNITELLWGNFQTKHGVISPKIAANNIVIRADDTYIYLEIANAEYETSPGITVHMNLTQKFTYNAVKAQNGNYVFIPDITGFGEPQITSNVSLSEGMVITEIIMDVVAVITSILCAVSGIAEAIDGVAEVATDVVANTAEVSLSADAIAGVAADSPEMVTIENEAGAEAADIGAADPENASQIQKCGVFTSTKFRLATGLTAAISGSITGSIGIAKAVTQQEYNQIPALNTFAINCIGATKWPSLSNYTLLGANFQTSLVMGISMDVEN